MKAICVRAIDYKDNDKLLTLCTLERGKVTVCARGAKKPSAKLSFATIPFCFGDYQVLDGKGLVLTGCDLIDNFEGLSEEIERYYAGFAVLEILSKLMNEQANGKLFLTAVNALKDLCYDAKSFMATLIVFFANALESCGYKLNFAVCSKCKKELTHGFFEAESGLICTECVSYGGAKLDAETLFAIKNSIDGKCEQSSVAGERKAITFFKQVFYELFDLKINSLSN